MYQLTLLQRFLSHFIAETIIFRKYRTTAFSREIFFPDGTQPRWKITEIPTGSGLWQAPPRIGRGLKQKCPCWGQEHFLEQHISMDHDFATRLIKTQEKELWQFEVILISCLVNNAHVLLVSQARIFLAIVLQIMSLWILLLKMSPCKVTHFNSLDLISFYLITAFMQVFVRRENYTTEVLFLDCKFANFYTNKFPVQIKILYS